jgi:hypothetical protein
MKPQDRITQNPGASVGATGSLSLVVVWIAGNLFHWAISAEDGVVMATIISAVALFVANNGLAGIVRIFVWGRDRGQKPEVQQT